MIHHIYEFNREKVSKKQYHRHHAETHFEDPIRGDFFNYFTQKEPTLCLESSAREGLKPFHYGPGGKLGSFRF